MNWKVNFELYLDNDNDSADFTGGLPYFKDVQWSWNGERYLNFTTHIQLGGRLCIIKGLYWDDWDDNSGEIPVVESVNFTISSDRDICHSRQVSAHLFFENIDGSYNFISHNFIPFLTSKV